jgi:hypothetical protein
MSRPFHPFDHIDEKLERALQHIGDLQVEVETLLDTLPYRAVSDGDLEALKDLRNMVSELRMPPRAAILAGEAIHQIRSSLDHIASALVIANNRKVTPGTQFPIYVYRPSCEKEARRYEDHIRGMTPSAKALIDGLQPCNAADRHDNSLTILKALNNFDKHQALLVTAAVTRPVIHFTLDGARVSEDDPAKFPILKALSLARADMNVEGQFAAHVVFPKFGTATDQPVVRSLLDLWASVVYNVRQKFRVELTTFPWER